MGNIASMVKALIGGYGTAVVSQAVLALLITREGRAVLMDGNRMSNAYHLQSAVAWFLSAAAAGAVALHFVPAAPPGLAVAAAVALLQMLLVLRNHIKMPRQQSMAVNLLLFFCIALGSAASCAVLLKKS
jgi:hypothetical protein